MMSKNIIYCTGILFMLLMQWTLSCNMKPKRVNQSMNQVEFVDFIENLRNNYIYLEDDSSLLNCIESEYGKYVDTLTHTYFKVLFYETILNEFCDSHVSLNTNTDQSYRLRSPIYLELIQDEYFISNVFSSQLGYDLSDNIIKAKVLQFNNRDFSEVVNEFPIRCNDKSNQKNKEWIANKIVSGKRNEPRIIEIELKNGDLMSLDIDSLILKEEENLIDTYTTDEIGVIRLNNSLGNRALVQQFDLALDRMLNSKAIILDLRNTPNGGNTSVAEPIMGRFISETKGYQICESKNKKYTKNVKPKKRTYTNPVYILVGRWTGSMGEGMAIGFDGMKRAKVIGTKMNRLAGGIKTFQFLNSDFGFNISFEKMYHINGTLRETYIPAEYIIQSNPQEDLFIRRAKELIRGDNHKDGK